MAQAANMSAKHTSFQESDTRNFRFTEAQMPSGEPLGTV